MNLNKPPPPPPQFHWTAIPECSEILNKTLRIIARMPTKQKKRFDCSKNVSEALWSPRHSACFELAQTLCSKIAVDSQTP